MSVVVVATIVPKDGCKDALADLYTQGAAGVHEEAGCELYAVHTTREQIVIIEKWADMDSLRAHGEGTVIAELRARAKDLQDSAEIVVARPQPGTTGKGAL
jgi:quinol monooxygenase YgiN